MCCVRARAYKKKIISNFFFYKFVFQKNFFFFVACEVCACKHAKKCFFQHFFLWGGDFFVNTRTCTYAHVRRRTRVSVHKL